MDAEFRKAWMPLFCRSGHPVVTPGQFLDFVGHLLPQEPYLDLPRVTGRDLQEVARAKKSTVGELDGWAWNELKALPLPWFSGLAIPLELVETSGIWPQGLLDAKIAMIPKADGDSTPRSTAPQRAPGCVQAVGFPNRCVASVMVYPRWRPGSPLRWILRRFFLGLVVFSCMSWLLMSSSLLILLMGPFWIALWGGSVCLNGFVVRICLFIFGFVSGSSSLLVLESDGVGMVVFTRVNMVFIVALYVPWRRHLDSLPDVKPQHYADNLKCSAERPGTL